MAKLVPGDPKAEDGPNFDQQALDTPVVALANATREVLSVGDAIERMLIRAENAFKHNDLAPLQEVSLLEKKVDRRQQEVKVYLSQLGRKGLADDEARRSIAIIDYAINLEHIGDIIEKAFASRSARRC